MVHGSEHVPVATLPEAVIGHLRRRRGFLVGRSLTPENARTLPGRLLIRSYQGEIAEKVVFELHREGVLPVPMQTARRLAFLVRNYCRVGPGCVAEAASLDDGVSDRLLAMAAALEYADWSDLDGSRVDREALAQDITDAERFLRDLQFNPSPMIEEDGDLPCLLPRVLRSHYLHGGSSVIQEDGAVRFSVRVTLPPTLQRSPDDDAFSTLSGEWRSHLLPSRLYRKTAYDHLSEYAGVELRFTEPLVEDMGDGGTFLGVPRFVREFWIAGRWFNLGDAAQLLTVLGGQPILSDLEEPIDPWTACEEFALKPSLRRVVDRPRLSRRVLIVAHLRFTRGHPLLASIFYRQLHHDLFSSHGERPRTWFLLLTHVEDYLKNVLPEIWLRQRSIPVDDRTRRHFSFVGEALRDGPVTRATALENIERFRGTPSAVIAPLLEQCIIGGAASLDDESVSLRWDTLGGAALLAGGSQLAFAGARLPFAEEENQE